MENGALQSQSRSLGIGRGTQRRAVHYQRQTGIGNEEQSMASLSYKSSRPDGWTMPRPHRDPSVRYMMHGPIQPMEQPGFLARLFGFR
jgi:hypothetical protein